MGVEWSNASLARQTIIGFWNQSSTLKRVLRSCQKSGCRATFEYDPSFPRETLVASCCSFVYFRPDRLYLSSSVIFLVASLVTCQIPQCALVRHTNLVLNSTHWRKEMWKMKEKQKKRMWTQSVSLFPSRFRYYRFELLLRVSGPRRSFETSAQVHYKKKPCRRFALGHFAMARWESKIKDTLIAYFCIITYKDDFKKVENLCACKMHFILATSSHRKNFSYSYSLHHLLYSLQNAIVDYPYMHSYKYLLVEEWCKLNFISAVEICITRFACI